MKWDRLSQEFDRLKLVKRGWSAPNFNNARVALLQCQENPDSRLQKEEERKREKKRKKLPVIIVSESAITKVDAERSCIPQRTPNVSQRKEEESPKRQINV